MNKDLWRGRVGPYRVGVLFNLPSFWVGAHYSPYNKRYCVNVVPTFTVWVTLPGGNEPGGYHD